MNLFWKKLFGKLHSTERFESELKQLRADFARYKQVEESNEIKEYKKLHELVTTAKFKEVKRTLIKRKYKDCEEYRDATKFEKLSKDSGIQLFYKTIESPIFNAYLEFKKDPKYSLLSDPKAVKESAELTRFKEFEHSNEYKNYIRLHDSYITKEFEELKVKVNSAEFKKSNAFWSNKDRYKLTEEYKQEVRFKELENNPDIKYFNTQNPKRFDAIKHFELGYCDNFTFSTLSGKRWEYGFYRASDKLKAVHSFVDQKQAYTNGKNVRLENNSLFIYTRKEKEVATAWDSKNGFINKEFDYTSSVINGSQAACQKGGIFRGKIRFKGDGLTHQFALNGKNGKLPQINIVCVRNGKIEVGYYKQIQNNVKYISQEISGISPSDFYDYTVLWTNNQLVWYINNFEVFRVSDAIPNEELFPTLSSYISKDQKGSEGVMEIDYVETYHFI